MDEMTHMNQIKPSFEVKSQKCNMTQLNLGLHHLHKLR